MKGKPTPHAWANQTWFYPDSLIDGNQFLKDAKTMLAVSGSVGSGKLTVGEACKLLQSTAGSASIAERVQKDFGRWGWKDGDLSRPITRGELAKLIDETLDPFKIGVNHQGKILKTN